MEEYFLNFIKPWVEYINNVLITLIPNGQQYLVFLIALLISYSVKSKSNWGKIGFILLFISVYGALRWIGIGG